MTLPYPLTPHVPRAALEAESARRVRLEAALKVCAETLETVDQWLGQASTRQAAVDALWRMGRELQAAGFDRQSIFKDRPGGAVDDLKWRGSILKELNDAGFFHSDEKNAFVYDPTAEKEKPYRVYGNAIGPTLKEFVALLAAEQDRDPHERGGR